MFDETRKAARIIYTLNIVFFYIRILEILSVNQYLGPYVKIIGKLVSIHFVQKEAEWNSGVEHV